MGKLQPLLLGHRYFLHGGGIFGNVVSFNPPDTPKRWHYGPIRAVAPSQPAREGWNGDWQRGLPDPRARLCLLLSPKQGVSPLPT